jgi:hypothetical protein
LGRQHSEHLSLCWALERVREPGCQGQLEVGGAATLAASIAIYRGADEIRGAEPAGEHVVEGVSQREIAHGSCDVHQCSSDVGDGQSTDLDAIGPMKKSSPMDSDSAQRQLPIVRNRHVKDAVVVEGEAQPERSRC